MPRLEITAEDKDASEKWHNEKLLPAVNELYDYAEVKNINTDFTVNSTYVLGLNAIRMGKLVQLRITFKAMSMGAVLGAVKTTVHKPILNTSAVAVPASQSDGGKIVSGTLMTNGDFNGYCAHNMSNTSELSLVYIAQ